MTLGGEAVMFTRAKFRCLSVRKYQGTVWSPEGNNPNVGFLYEAEFHAVTDKNGENASFFASTPNGQLKLSTVRDDLFTPGQFYYLDFTASDN